MYDLIPAPGSDSLAALAAQALIAVAHLLTYFIKTRKKAP